MNTVDIKKEIEEGTVRVDAARELLKQAGINPKDIKEFEESIKQLYIYKAVMTITNADGHYEAAKYEVLNILNNEKPHLLQRFSKTS